MNNVLIQGIDFSEEELSCLNRGNEYEINFTVLNSKNIIDPGMVLVFAELIRNISYSAAYDTLKYVLELIINKINNSNSATTHIEVIYDKKKTSININFPLSEEQKDKIIDGIIKKITED